LRADVDRHGATLIQEDAGVSQLVSPTVPQILEFCACDPIERVFLEDVARRGIGNFTAVENGGGLAALCHVGANLVPAGEGCDAFAEPALRGRATMMIGEERAVSELWSALSARMPAPREVRNEQPVFVIDEPPAAGGTGLRPATPSDFDVLLPACASAHEEELGIDPLERDGGAFRWRTRNQIDEGRSWLWAEDGVVLFKAEASAWTPRAVQVQQVWVDPEARGRGHAQRGMRDLIRLLLATTPRVCLFVRPENASAIRVYERVGMRRVLSYRSVIF
jgi:RimJ/RimL family protein N-acetyltransferase